MVLNPFAKKKSEYRVGIDIGTSSIKVVELLRQGNSAALNNYAQFFTKGEYMTTKPGSFNILDSQIAEILKQTFQAANFNSRTAIVALPVFSSFSTLINLPSMSPEELEDAVKYEARKYIPVPISEVQFDWTQVAHLSTADSLKILTVAVPNEIVEKYNRIAQAANVEFENMELETFSSARALIKDESVPAAILDVGSRTTNISIIDQGIVVLHHNIDTGGFALTRILARGMAIDPKRAEDIKINQGLESPDGQVSELLQPFIDKIILELEQAMEDYIREGGRRPASVILTGGGGKMPGLSGYIQDSINIDTEYGDPFQKVQVPPPLQNILQSTSSNFSVAVGLALR
ncbi:MAG: type IV pilus assembly protein PilM [Candidatus Spechtbacterales bacterium]